MMASFEQHPTAASRWTLRMAAFSGLLVITAIVLHRLAGMATPIALTLMGSGLAGAALSLLLAAVALLQLWRRQGLGSAHVVGGIGVALAIFAWPAAYVPAFLRYPALVDVSTDTAAPPRFSAIGERRVGPANAAAYPGAGAAALQTKAYPDIRTFVIDRSAEEAFEFARDAVRRSRMQIVAEEPPGDAKGKTVEGVIEAVDRTLVIGFYDDVVVRVRGDERQARVDIRSSSRYGRHDLGRNATRIRFLLKEIQARLDSTIPGTPAAARLARLRGRVIQGALPRRAASGDRATTARQPGRVSARSDARREPEQKGQPPARGGGRGRDTQD